jgi:xanthine/CO dehydrogenase XdhC/CoxF family maturation factor
LGLEFYRCHRDRESLVLANIVPTERSAYRKPGAMMLIKRDGAYEGMISGGCSDGDSLDHAAVVLEFGQPVNVSYDMRAGNVPVWNLGIGCESLTIHGSAGLDFGSELPATIAPSITAKIRAVLNGRSGQSLVPSADG